MLSRELVGSLAVNTSPGKRVASPSEVAAFGIQVGYPLMIKALDGGGGRGIRHVNGEGEVGEAFKRWVTSSLLLNDLAVNEYCRCLGESPSRQVFVEKALTGPGWKHIEIQIIGDGTGAVNHFWERDCSVQRRFQKVVEVCLASHLHFALEAERVLVGTFTSYQGYDTSTPACIFKDCSAFKI
jgi:pyruvate carboxylase